MARKYRALGLLLLSLSIVACTGRHSTERALTVAQIWEDPPAFGNQMLRIQGRAEFLIEQTLQACDPPTCDCNHSGGHLSLLDPDDMAAGRRDRVIWVAATETDLQCEGDECDLVCRPFDPRPAETIELLGRLHVQRTDVDGYYLILDDLDIAVSRREIAGRWELIPIETVTITLREP
jgi:hypothetical protein